MSLIILLLPVHEKGRAGNKKQLRPRYNCGFHIDGVFFVDVIVCYIHFGLNVSVGRLVSKGENPDITAPAIDPASLRAPAKATA